VLLKPRLVREFRNRLRRWYVPAGKIHYRRSRNAFNRCRIMVRLFALTLKRDFPPSESLLQK
jgi:hypothetical protein